MGVDYSANYGMGVKLCIPDFEENGEIEFMEDYLEELPKSENIDIEYFEVGDGNYTGEENEFYLCIKNPMENGELFKKIEVFKKYLSDNNIKYYGEVDLVGGLYVY